jgi:hypothetical protein
MYQHHPRLGTPPLFNPRIQHPLTPPLNLPFRAPLHNIHLPCQALNSLILPPSRCHRNLPPYHLLQHRLYHYLGCCIFMCRDICMYLYLNLSVIKKEKLTRSSNATPSPPTGTQIVPLAPPPKPLSSSTVSQIPLPIYTSTSSPCAWSGKYSSRNDNVSAYLSSLVLDSCKSFPFLILHPPKDL